MLNGHIESALTRQGHMDLMMVVDAGFPCPDEVELIDIALAEDRPSVKETLVEILRVHSVEKIVMAKEAVEHNPTWVEAVKALFGDACETEIIDHSELKERSHGAKTIVRTGDFTAWSNVMLVSGAGDRWRMEKK